MTPRHYSEDDLTLFFYGEARRPAVVQEHLESCPQCAAIYADIAATLTLVAPSPVPERGELYGLEVWQRIRTELPEIGAGQSWSAWLLSRLVPAAGIAVLVVAAFVAGRSWPRSPEVAPAMVERTVATDAPGRVRLAAIADHLERSERLLLDVVNADEETINLGERQTMAAALLDANRVYRQASRLEGDLLVADVLDHLERNLLDLVHAPATLTATDLVAFRERLDAGALLFKVRVLADELSEREQTPPSSSPSPSVTTT